MTRGLSWVTLSGTQEDPSKPSCYEVYRLVSHERPLPVKKERNMVSRQHEQPTLQWDTDTAVPRTPIPIFYVHEGDHPFCLQPNCICLAYDEKMKALLQRVLDGELKLRKSYN